MPPDYRVASPTGTPISPPVAISVSSTETLLIAFAVGVALFMATLFLLGVWYFVSRLKNEQERTNRIERRESSDSGTGSKPDAPPPGQDFLPQAQMKLPEE